MNKPLLYASIGVFVIIALFAFFQFSPFGNSVVYKNADYGFTFSLPVTWKGYSIVKSEWQGFPLKETVAVTSGPKLVIRNPNWTEAAHYEDLPILVFTISQWNAYLAEDFSVSAAPIPASELGRNNTYVFALPPRWDFDLSLGYEEAQNIFKAAPLHPFDL
mgnify:CR=1 FL=1